MILDTDMDNGLVAGVIVAAIRCYLLLTMLLCTLWLLRATILAEDVVYPSVPVAGG